MFSTDSTVRQLVSAQVGAVFERFGAQVARVRRLPRVHVRVLLRLERLPANVTASITEKGPADGVFASGDSPFCVDPADSLFLAWFRESVHLRKGEQIALYL